jgi:hypothetical protein
MFTRDDILMVSIDSRTGKFILKALDDVGITGRANKVLAAENRINQAPQHLVDTLARLRYQVLHIA